MVSAPGCITDLGTENNTKEGKRQTPLESGRKKTLTGQGASPIRVPKEKDSNGASWENDRLAGWSAGSYVAVETVGNWYWIVDEIEQAGMKPKLVHAHKADIPVLSEKPVDNFPFKEYYLKIAYRCS